MSRYFPGQAISRIHGQPRRVDDVTVVPMYHPAAALHRGDLRSVIEADFSRLPALLEQAAQEPDPSQDDAPAAAEPALATAAEQPGATQERLL